MDETEEFEFRRRYEMEKAKPKAKEPVKRQDAPIGGASFDPNTGEVVIDDGSRGGNANALDAAVRGFGRGLASIFGGEKAKAHIDQTNAPYKEQFPVAHGVGQFVGEVAPTLPVGGVLAKGLTKVAPAATELAAALRGGGFGADAGNLATRATGGAITGAAQSALIDSDPTSVGVGAVLGGALGGVGRGVQAMSKAVPEGVSAARELGYVMPPSQAGGGLTAHLLEGLSGKAATAQQASAKNQTVTNSLAAKALGLADDVQLSPEVLDAVRADAGKAYDALAKLPVKPAESADSLMNRAASAEIDPKKMVYDLRVARQEADAYYKAYGRSADPEQLTKAKMAKANASRIETELEKYAASMGKEDLLPALRDARQQIAKTYTVEKALNPTTGSVDAKVLAKELQKGKPLSGELKQAADFAKRFKKAVQTPEQMGSLPGVSPLDFAYAGAGGGYNIFQGDNAAEGALAGLAFRPAARAAILSKFGQDRLAKASGVNQKLVDLLRAAPASVASVKKD